MVRNTGETKEEDNSTKGIKEGRKRVGDGVRKEIISH
jgi:hypothetical protein